MSKQRRYWIISPNVKKNDEVGSWISFLSKNPYSCVGWGDNDPLGSTFAKSISSGDIIITAQRRNWIPFVYGIGVVDSNAEYHQIDEMPSDANIRHLYPFIPADEIPEINFEGCSYLTIQVPKAVYELKDKKVIEKVELLMNHKISKMKVQEIKDLLIANKNIILTGAPGTGKTWTAIEVAKSMGAETDFVQFHPSYDYTDFVEGLRPVKGDNENAIGFERRDGVFKTFCKRALHSSNTQSNFDKVYNAYIEDLLEQEELELETLIQHKKFKIDVNSNHNITVHTSKTQMVVTREMLKLYFESDKILDWKPYTTSIGEDLKKKHPELDVKKAQIDKGKKYVFIIDEINRGEISKIFGELFFSVDPGYRGKDKGMVKTQYQNLLEEGDDFYDGFYIPENVYIIGTMNDIDRSVESMDFAMRRRFVFKEITAEESRNMLDSTEAWKKHGMEKPDASVIESIKKKMTNLNKAISNIEGLNSAFHIGAAYFFSTDFDNLWTLKLNGLLREYLRGSEDIDKKMDTLKEAFIAKEKKEE